MAVLVRGWHHQSEATVGHPFQLFAVVRQSQKTTINHSRSYFILSPQAGYPLTWFTNKNNANGKYIFRKGNSCHVRKMGTHFGTFTQRAVLLLWLLVVASATDRRSSTMPVGFKQPTQEQIALGAYYIRDITGPDITTKFGFEGTDLGIPYELPNGSGMYLFGDTFDGMQPGSPGWRSPVGVRSQTGYTPGTNLTAGIVWDNAAGGARAKELTVNYHQTTVAHGPNGSYKFSEFTVIPSDAITLNGKVYMFTSSVHDWGSTWWATNFCFVSVCDRDPYGETFYRTDTFWPNNGQGDLRQQITLARNDDGWVYAVGSSFSRSIDGMLLMRVREGNILDKSQWQEWGWRQADGWKWRGPYQGTPFLPDACGETSLRKIEGVWVLSYFDPKRYAIVTRWTKNIEAPWSNPQVQVYGGSWGPGDGGRGFPPGTVAQLYGGFIHPKSTLNRLTIIVSQWRNPGGWPYRAMQFTGSIALGNSSTTNI